MSIEARDPSPRGVRIRLFLLFALVTGIAVAVLVGLALNAREVGDFAQDSGPLELPLMFLVIATLTPALVSAGLLSAAAGYVLGLAVGFPVALAGLTVGALLAVFLVRRVASRGAAEALGTKVSRLAAWLESRPFRSVVFSRLVPGLPFAYTSYACGLTAIPTSTIAAGTAAGFAPRCFVYTALGGSIHDLGSPEARVAIAATVAIGIGSLVLPRFFPQFSMEQKTTTEPRYRWTT
ncbi:MAG TPA: VTT domain-containing protein [Solirubrobacterales bacterium]|nr:VTT domain-containing protein [Solirubrobacterales bacterium]